jgi:hypothetical protein
MRPRGGDKRARHFLHIDSLGVKIAVSVRDTAPMPGKASVTGS